MIIVEVDFTATNDAEITCIFCMRAKCDLESTVQTQDAVNVTVGLHTACLLRTEARQSRIRMERFE